MDMFPGFRDEEREHLLGAGASISQFFMEGIDDDDEKETALAAYEGAMFFLGALAVGGGRTAGDLVKIGREAVIDYLQNIVNAGEVAGE